MTGATFWAKKGEVSESFSKLLPFTFLLFCGNNYSLTEMVEDFCEFDTSASGKPADVLY